MRIFLTITLLAVLFWGTSCSKTKPAPDETDTANGVSANIVVSWNSGDTNIVEVDNGYLIFKQTTFVSCGPYTINVRFKLNGNHISLPKKVSLVEIGYAGKVLLNQDGRITISRNDEYRHLKNPAITSSRSIFQLTTNKVHTLQTGWTGERIYSAIDGEEWCGLPSNGTRVLGALHINIKVIEPITVSLTCP